MKSGLVAVLIVAVEVCSTAFRLDHLTKANMVATALFGDGAAACFLRTDERGIAAIEGAGEHMWPDTSTSWAGTSTTPAWASSSTATFRRLPTQVG
jgi:predicted naringenin-chalcone synthase